MGRVCLIVPLSSAADLPRDLLTAYRGSLEQAGYSVEAVAVLGADSEGPAPDLGALGTWVRPATRDEGLSVSMIAGLSRTSGDYSIVIDPTRGYEPADLPRLIGPLVEGAADLAVAKRSDRATHGWGRIARPILGISEPFGGLVAITSEVAREMTGTFDPVGDRFVIDLLFRSGGRRVDVPIRVDRPDRAAALSFDDLRHIKRLSDDRFGNISRLVQFCAVGASGMVVDLSTYALFQLVFSRTWLTTYRAPLVGSTLDLAAAGALAIALALTWNFSLNRRLTFNYARDGSIVRQFFTYALSNALGILLSFTLRLYLPAKVKFFGQHRLAAAFVGIVAATGISFSMARWLVFGKRRTSKWEPVETVGSVAESSV